jgi:hypothetical protein
VPTELIVNRRQQQRTSLQADAVFQFDACVQSGAKPPPSQWINLIRAAQGLHHLVPEIGARNSCSDVGSLKQFKQVTSFPLRAEDDARAAG